MTPFKERMNLYRAYRELNPGKNYWDWKASLEVPAMQDGGNTEDYVGQLIDLYALQEAINQTGRDLYVADHTDPNTGVVSPFYDKNIDAYGTYQLPEPIIKPEYKSAQQMKRALNAAAANRGRLYYHDAMREIDAGRKVAELAEWTPVGDVIDLTKAGIAATLGDYLTAGALSLGLLLPNFLGKPLQTAKRNAQKIFRRRSRRPDVYMHDDFVNTSEFAARESVRKEGIPQFKTRPTFTDKDLRRISRSYSKYMNAMHETIFPTPQLVELYDRIDGLSASERMQLYKIIDDDPAYGKFIYDHPNLNPLSQQTVDAFLKLQSASLRGVSFPVETSDDLVKVALSHTSDRHRGGDRLNTNGLALYTSNSGEIGNRFSRPIGDVGKTRSDIAKLTYDFKIDKRLPISDQLALARRQIFNVDFASDMEYLDTEHLAKHGYVAKEAQYTNRFGKSLPAYERAYFPTQHTPLNTPAVQIENVSTRIGLDDAKGRWGIGGVDPHEIDDLLFVGANVGRSLGDYVRLMKTLKSSTTQEINTEYIDRLRELERIFTDDREARFDQYRNLYKKFENSTPHKVLDVLDFVLHANPGYNKTIAEQIVGFGKVGLGLDSGVALSKNLARSLFSDDAEFADSHLFQQIYDDITVGEDLEMFRRAKRMWQINNTATLDDFLKRFPEYEEVLLKQDNDVVPAMQSGGDITNYVNTNSKSGSLWNWTSDLYDEYVNGAPANYADNRVAIMPNGKTTDECAEYSNSILRGEGFNIWGDAWTRGPHKDNNNQKILSGYSGLSKPKSWDERAVENYLNNAVKNFAANVDTTQFKQNDIVGIHAAGSGHLKEAYNNGYGEDVLTHTGHIVVGQDGTHYVIHNVNGRVVLNKAADLLGGTTNKRYNIVNQYRPRKRNK